MANRVKRRSISLALLNICAGSAEALRDGSAVRKTDKRKRSQKAKQTKASERGGVWERNQRSVTRKRGDGQTRKSWRRAPRRRVRCSNTSSELQAGAGASGHYGQHDCKLFDPLSARLGGPETEGVEGQRNAALAYGAARNQMGLMWAMGAGGGDGDAHFE